MTLKRENLLSLIVNPFSFFEFIQARKKKVLQEKIINFCPKQGISKVFHDDLIKELDLYLASSWKIAEIIEAKI